MAYGHNIAIIHGLRVWRHILLSTPHIITIYTDHKNLTFYRSAHRIMQQVAWYLGELADYHFTLVHKPKTSNCVDAFLQWPDHNNRAFNNEDIVVLGLELFANVTKLLSLEQDIFAKQEKHEEQMREL